MMQQFGEFVVNHWELFLALAAILVLLAGTTLGGRLRGIQGVTPTEATRLISHDGAVVVDVREENEFAGGHIVNSRHIPLSALQNRLGELDQLKSKPIIVSCRSGSRSNSACSILKKNGFETVFNLSGGMLAWQNANLPVTKK